MQIEAFWKHWQVVQDPFGAEEARRDPVLLSLLDGQTAHPEFAKVLGQPDRPTPAVVFGEKGSGKTALRVMLERRIAEHNQNHPQRKALVVIYDDLNGPLDRIVASVGRRDRGEPLKQVRTVDHQDAILGEAVTKLVDGLLSGDAELGPKPGRTAKRMSKFRRLDLATLVAIYDHPGSGSPGQRWGAVKKMLRVGGWPGVLGGVLGARWVAILAGLGAIAAWLWEHFTKSGSSWPIALTGGLAGVAVVMAGYWVTARARVASVARRVAKDVRSVPTSAAELRRKLADLPSRQLKEQPLPDAKNADSRYQLTHRLLGVAAAFGYTGMIVVVDRLDEPTAVGGDPTRMHQAVRSLLSNKFLQQEGVGVKMLLPLDLKQPLQREEAEFFQNARLDKQHTIERLAWSGAALYDLCQKRLSACRESGVGPITLMQLFEPTVAKQEVIDALEQMQHPRDAMKFVYRLIQEHCLELPEDEPAYQVPRSVLQQVRRQQAMRVSDAHRGAWAV